MTQALAESISTTRFVPESSRLALRVAIGSMVAHDASLGKDPYGGIDVERLFSAIRMLGSRNALEVTPFVQSWSPVLQLTANNQFPAFFAKNFKESLADRFDSRLERQFREGVEAVAGLRDTEEPFQRLAEAMTDRLIDLLVFEPSDITYLAPILSTASPIKNIVTLNYDLGVEAVADMAGLAYDTGVSGWAGGMHWYWDDDCPVHLLKLHGSVNWTHYRKISTGRLNHDEIIVNDNPHEYFDPERYRVARPSIVFGSRDKLRSDGPFLAMLYEFHRMLEVSDHLIVVGYSFRDDHINSAISNYLTRSDRKLTIIDPGINSRTPQRNESNFLRSLLTSMHEATLGEHNEYRGAAWPISFRVLEATASEGIAQIFGNAPPLHIPERKVPDFSPTDRHDPWLGAN